MKTAYYPSPVGVYRITEMDGRMVELRFTVGVQAQSDKSPLLEEASRQLDDYFAGNRTGFDLPLAPDGTEFQMKVWEELSRIAYDSTLTYLELAERLNDNKTVRAVGRANGQNAIPIIIPCQRVIGAGGKLTGYAGGVERKKWLLKHEGALLL